MSKPKKMPKPFDIPENILDKINECSQGGFFLFCLDDQGNFRPYSTFDNELVFSYLKENIVRYFNAISEIEKTQMLHSLLQK